MINIAFVLALAVLLTAFLWWGFKKLPKEESQIFAAMPLRKKDAQSWDGVNLTYYGILIASAQVFAVAIMTTLMGALCSPWYETFLFVAILLGVCVPASRAVAKIVEKKTATFTVGGASFIGMLLAPFVIPAANLTICGGLPVVPCIAAMAISYAYGEGIGRLACISFGCCYGKPLAGCGPFVRKLFLRRSFVFTGKTKKIAYESGLDDQKVIPIQAITSIIYVSTGLVSTIFFLEGLYGWSLIVGVCCTQGWRFISEILRADFRGRGRLSAYRIMSLLLVSYPFFIIALFPADAHLLPDIVQGLKEIVNPFLILSLQGIWLIVFIYLGRSRVTGSTISFYVHKDRI